MLIRPLRLDEKELYNSMVQHPLQSWEWGEFRARTGLKVERIGFFDGGKLQHALQISFHPIPVIGMNAGYVARGFMPDEEQLAGIKQIAKKNNALFVKLEPNIIGEVGVPSAHPQIADFLIKNGSQPGRHILPKYTFIIDLQKTEEELFAALSSKTRYNVNLAIRKGVKIVEQTSEQGMQVYVDILKETIKRQGFYAHSPDYFTDMWKILGNSGMLRIFHAVYEGQVLTAWVMFIQDNVLYYPYGASLREHRDVMASNLMAWEMIRFGQQNGCHTFDMWGSLGPEPDKNHPWYGFHRFKKSYGGKLSESVGSYDLVINKQLYPLFRIADNARWSLLKLKSKLGL